LRGENLPCVVYEITAQGKGGGEFIFSLSLERGEGRVRVKYFLSLRVTVGSVAISVRTDIFPGY
jgi:hypothetical protein